MKKSVFAGLIAASMAAAVSIPAVYAGYGEGDGCREGRTAMRYHDMHKHGPGGKMDREAQAERQFDRMAERLNLSEEQKDTLAATRDSSREEMTTLRDKLSENRLAMRELSPADEDFVSRSESLVAEKADLQQQIARIRINEKKAMYDLLNEEQREQMTAMSERRHGEEGKDKPHRF